jgi:hypothetical protein
VRLLLSEVRGWDEARGHYRRAARDAARAEELDETRLESIDQVLSAHPGDCEVYLHIVRPDHSRLAMRSRRYRVAEDDQVVTRLKDRHPGLRVRWSRGAA